MKFVDNSGWDKLTPEEKRKMLFIKQKKILDDFLACGAISEEQYKKSLGDMQIKMGFTEAKEA